MFKASDQSSAEDSVIDQTVFYETSQVQIETAHRSATMNLPPPPHFVVDGAKADDFATWLDMYTTWEVSMKLSAEAPKVQAATLKTVLGPNGQKLL